MRMCIILKLQRSLVSGADEIDDECRLFSKYLCRASAMNAIDVPCYSDT